MIPKDDVTKLIEKYKAAKGMVAYPYAININLKDVDKYIDILIDFINKAEGNNINFTTYEDWGNYTRATSALNTVINLPPIKKEKIAEWEKTHFELPDDDMYTPNILFASEVFDFYEKWKELERYLNIPPTFHTEIIDKIPNIDKFRKKQKVTEAEIKQFQSDLKAAQLQRQQLFNIEKGQVHDKLVEFINLLKEKHSSKEEYIGNVFLDLTNDPSILGGPDNYKRTNKEYYSNLMRAYSMFSAGIKPEYTNPTIDEMFNSIISSFDAVLKGLQEKADEDDKAEKEALDEKLKKEREDALKKRKELLEENKQAYFECTKELNDLNEQKKNVLRSIKNIDTEEEKQKMITHLTALIEKEAQWTEVANKILKGFPEIQEEINETAETIEGKSGLT